MAELGEQIGNDPALARRTLDWLALIGGTVVMVVTCGLMWWAGLFRRRGFEDDRPVRVSSPPG
jgi:hypothetical protein